MALETLDDSQLERILVVVAHPDDAEYGISCAVKQWTDAGKEVAYLLVTAGEAGIRSLPPEECGPLRAEEQRRACAAVGVEELKILDFPDGLVEHSHAVRRAIASKIRKFKPDTVAIMMFGLQARWGLNHVDHRAVGVSTIDAIRDADNPWIFQDLDLPAHKAQRLLVANDPDSTHVQTLSAEAVAGGVASLSEHKRYLEELPDHPRPEDFIPQMVALDGGGYGLRVHVYDPV